VRLSLLFTTSADRQLRTVQSLSDHSDHTVLGQTRARRVRDYLTMTSCLKTAGVPVYTANMFSCVCSVSDVGQTTSQDRPVCMLVCTQPLSKPTGSSHHTAADAQPLSLVV